MSHDWIIGVLTDIEAYASENGLNKTFDAVPQLRLIVDKELGAIRQALRAVELAEEQPTFRVIQGGANLPD
ncbi:hypothetical protein [Sagittula sp. S175]|uniref:hypothetical protein n=1 Tax=Sagittula sp. S175 TaxID=3415129 RepID=UPI003C7E9055